MALAALLVAACASATQMATPRTLLVEVVNYQVVAERSSRLVVAAITQAYDWASLRNPHIVLAPVDASKPQMTIVPERFDLPGDKAGVVYVASDLVLPSAGPWQATLSGQAADGSSVAGESAFEVLDGPTSPLVGDAAPTSEPALSAMLGRGRPLLVVFASREHCAGRYCAAVADLATQLAITYADRVGFAEIDPFAPRGDLNEEVAGWLGDNADDYHQPWTFLVDRAGRIVGSWDTIVTRDEIEPLLKALPVSSSDGAQPSGETRWFSTA